MSSESVPLRTRTTGTLSKCVMFKNIKTLLKNYNEAVYSETFHLDFTSWKLFIEKIKGEGEKKGSYLSIYLEKVDNEYENQFSYHVKATYSILSTDVSKSVTTGEIDNTSRSRFVFGKRSGESMAWGSMYAISWPNLLNPQLGYIYSNEDSIEIQLKMELVSVMGHNSYCSCEAC